MADWVRRLAPSGQDWTPATLRQRHVAEAAVIADFVEQLGFGPTAWAIETAERVAEELGLWTEDWEASGTWGAQAYLSFQLGMLVELVVIQGEHLDTDHMDQRIVRLSAVNAYQRGLSLDVFTHRVWTGHTRAQREILGGLVQVVPPDQVAEEIRKATALLDAFATRYVTLLREAYETERQRSRGRVDASQRRAILEVARGAQPTTTTNRLVPSGFGGGHLYALAWGSATAGATDPVASARLAEEYGRALEAREVVVFDDDDLTHIWWRLDGLQGDEIARLRDLERPDGLHVAVGATGEQIAGFRHAFATARKSLRVARLGAVGDFWTYQDIAHIALLAEDRDGMAQFVREEIGPLLGPGQRRREVRETVRLYLAHGRSRVTVAELLHLSPKTIGYRVDQASLRMGTRINDNALGIRLALDLVHWFPHLADHGLRAAPEKAARAGLRRLGS